MDGIGDTNQGVYLWRIERKDKAVGVIERRA